MFGIVHYSNEGLETLTVHCESRKAYDSAITVACRWAEELTEDRRVWGEILDARSRRAAWYADLYKRGRAVLEAAR